jgi:hypothetical protein
MNEEQRKKYDPYFSDLLKKLNNGDINSEMALICILSTCNQIAQEERDRVYNLTSEHFVSEILTFAITQFPDHTILNKFQQYLLESQQQGKE